MVKKYEMSSKNIFPLHRILSYVPYLLAYFTHFFNQNFVSKFRVRDLCEETILLSFIMKLKCDNQ